MGKLLALIDMLILHCLEFKDSITVLRLRNVLSGRHKGGTAFDSNVQLWKYGVAGVINKGRVAELTFSGTEREPGLDCSTGPTVAN